MSAALWCLRCAGKICRKKCGKRLYSQKWKETVFSGENVSTVFYKCGKSLQPEKEYICGKRRIKERCVKMSFPTYVGRRSQKMCQKRPTYVGKETCKRDVCEDMWKETRDEKCVPACLIHMCDMTHSYVWHDSFTCVTWLIHMCDMTRTWALRGQGRCWGACRHASFIRDMTHSYVWHDSFICVTWLIHMSGMTYICGPSG